MEQISANIFNFCCKKDSKVSEVDKPKMDPVNGHFVVPAPVCPFSGESEMKTDKTVKPNLKIKVPKPIRLKNHQSLDETFDTLHNVEGISFNPTRCTEKVCQSSSMDIPSRGNAPLTPEEIYREAQSFLKEYFGSVGRNNTQAYKARLEEIKAELLATGTYNLKIPELKFGAKVAWRNASRCIGRIQWKKLEIFPCFEVRTAKGMFDALCYHIRYSTNKGNIRSAITIFPPRTDGQHDYRIWNPQLISYAGYVQPDGSILGDPGRVEFTDICIKLGWKPPRTAWDILPMVLSADGREPEYFEIPRDIVMEVEMEHPEYAWFKDMNLRWYALPAVSNMKLDCGGLEFTATAFNGWYMGTEIGCRNLCDSSRLNITEAVAKRMGLDTSSQTLWKDKALVEVNVAVLHSFQRDSVSIVNHHAASEQFIKHMNEETRVRGGCPSDWIWIVPPMSSSLTSVFHQELALYYLRPSYEYQEPAWKSYQWIKPEGNKPRRKFHFRQIARAVKVTAKMYGNALSKRIKATILYASETGKSEQYAKELGAIFSHAFHAQVYSMSEYETHSLEHETLVIIVTSTFGNGEPPANGVDFLDHLCSMLQDERKRGDHSSEAYTANIKSATPKSLMRSNSIVSPKNPLKRQLTRMESNKSYTSYTSNTDTSESMRPLGNVHYAVFALGSSAYPKFCNFGKYVDTILSELGAVNIHPVVCGDELYGQEQQFKSWSSDIFHIACETLAIDDNEMVKNAKKAFGQIPLTEKTVRFRKTNENPTPMKTALELSFRKQLISCSVKENKWLGYHDSTKATIFLNMELKSDLKYEPGDHVGVMPCNRKELVDVVLERIQGVDDFDKSIQLQVIKEVLTPTDILKKWEPHERIPTVSLRDIFTRFLDITTPPSSTVLKYLADTCTDENDAQKFNDLLEDSNKYNDWQHFHYPNVAEVLEQYPSCKPQASLLVALLPKLQPRFYSLSSSPLAHPKEIHLTVAVVVYKTQSGKTRYGVSSNYLLNQKPGDEVLVFIRRAPNFHLPKDLNVPLILVGPGSGIAPFRGFWHHRRHQIMNITDNKKDVGDVWLFFGCQNKAMDLYKEEKEQAHKDNVLTNNLLALSREVGLEKKHVQSLIIEKGEEITKFLMEENGHFYICGDCKMADDVQQTLKNVLKIHACLSDSEVDSFVLDLMEQNRYHEDIFGITLRTGEVQSASRQFAKTRHESEKNYQKIQEIS